MTDNPQWVDAAVFEGLFVKGLKVDAVLEAKLATAGYQLRRPEGRYSSEVFQRCISVAGAHLYPNLKPVDAERELGRLMVDGFAKTLLGSVMLAVLPLVPASVVVSRLPRWFKATSPGSEPKIEETGPQERLLTMPIQAGADPMPGLLCGILERLVRGWTSIEVASSQPTQTVYRIAWK